VNYLVMCPVIGDPSIVRTYWRTGSAWSTASGSSAAISSEMARGFG